MSLDFPSRQGRVGLPWSCCQSSPTGSWALSDSTEASPHTNGLPGAHSTCHAAPISSGMSPRTAWRVTITSFQDSLCLLQPWSCVSVSGAGCWLLWVPCRSSGGTGTSREGSRAAEGLQEQGHISAAETSQAPSIKFLTRKIVCPFLCNTPLGFFIMTSFPLVILERLYNCKSVIESNRISFGAWTAPCHGRSFGVK